METLRDLKAKYLFGIVYTLVMCIIMLTAAVLLDGMPSETYEIRYDGNKELVVLSFYLASSVLFAMFILYLLKYYLVDEANTDRKKGDKSTRLTGKQKETNNLESS